MLLQDQTIFPQWTVLDRWYYSLVQKTIDAVSVTT